MQSTFKINIPTQHSHPAVPPPGVHGDDRRPGGDERVVPLDAVEARGTVVPASHIQQS